MSFVCGETLKTYPFSKFQACTTVLTLVSRLHIRFPEVTHPEELKLHTL